MDIRTLTPTICKLMDIESPASSIDTVQEELISKLHQGGKDIIQKCLVFAPDAIGEKIHVTYPSYFTGLYRIVGHSEHLQSVIPPVTPVCFASMLSGASPEVHGIRKSERPVLTVDTIFDTIARAGKRTAIITTPYSSMDLIFRNRAIDYFIEEDDAKVVTKAVAVLEEDRHDFLVVYNQEYDDQLHKTHPFSHECLTALEHYNQSFLERHETVARVWDSYDWLMAYTPDYGGHFNEEKGKGEHGQDIPDDMNLIHHYAWSSRREESC